MTSIKTTYETADLMTQEVMNFWSSCVGKTVDRLEELPVLLDWHFAIEAAQNVALESRDWKSVDAFDKLMDECNMCIDYCKESM